MLTVDGLRALLAAGLQWSAVDVESYLGALRGRGLLQAGDAPIRAENSVLLLLALLTGFPAPAAVNEAMRLAAFCVGGTSSQREGSGWASISCTPAPVGIPLLATLTFLMTEVPPDGWIMPGGGCPYRLRRILGPQADLVLLEGFSREGSASVMSGIYFTDAAAVRVASGRALTTRTLRRCGPGCWERSARRRLTGRPRRCAG